MIATLADVGALERQPVAQYRPETTVFELLAHVAETGLTDLPCAIWRRRLDLATYSARDFCCPLRRAGRWDCQPDQFRALLGPDLNE